MGCEKEAVIYVSERIRGDEFDTHDEFREYLVNEWDTGDFNQREFK